MGEVDLRIMRRTITTTLAVLALCGCATNEKAQSKKLPQATTESQLSSVTQGHYGLEFDSELSLFEKVLVGAACYFLAKEVQKVVEGTAKGIAEDVAHVAPEIANYFGGNSSSRRSASNRSSRRSEAAVPAGIRVNRVRSQVRPPGWPVGWQLWCYVWTAIATVTIVLHARSKSSANSCRSSAS